MHNKAAIPTQQRSKAGGGSWQSGVGGRFTQGRLASGRPQLATSTVGEIRTERRWSGREGWWDGGMEERKNGEVNEGIKHIKVGKKRSFL